jgi:hypothetical protein
MRVVLIAGTCSLVAGERIRRMWMINGAGARRAFRGVFISAARRGGDEPRALCPSVVLLVAGIAAVCRGAATGMDETRRPSYSARRPSPCPRNNQAVFRVRTGRKSSRPFMIRVWEKTPMDNDAAKKGWILSERIEQSSDCGPSQEKGAA